MDIAIVTGAETPLGLRLIEDLIRQGCRVHGIGNNFSNVTFADKHFIAHAIDLSDLEAVARTAEAIIEKEKAIHILIHAIDVTPGAAFEQLPVGNLEAILKVGLLGPVMLTRMALPNLLRFRGQLINIIPANKSGHIASAVNALIEGGLREMNTALFDQARDAGLRVTNLILRQNTVTDDTTFADKHLQTRIDPEHVARTVEQLLNPNEPNVPNEITLYPRLSGAAEEVLPETALPIDPYNAVVLPPQEYCPPEQEAILTREPDQIERTIPYTDEEMEEKIASAIEDYESQPERHEEPKQNKKNKNKRKEREPKQLREPRAPRESKHDHEPKQARSERSDQSDDSKQDTAKDSEQSEHPKSRRGRRRGGRNRNKNREQQEDRTSNRGDERNKSGSKEKTSPVGDKSPSVEPKKDNKPEKAPRPGRNRSRKPVVRAEEKYAAYEQPNVPVTEHSKASSAPAKQDSFQPREVVVEAPKPPKAKRPAKAKKKPAAKTQQLELVSDTPTVKKKAAKKAAKKATKKVAAKKVAAKKAVKKVATKKTATKKAVKKTAAKKATKKRAVKKAAKKAE